ncbi:MAG: 4-hydroxythreonine-4-phosphate dehydrogenase PdxA [Verrucomicrobia bacterium]|nr:4-hydroxythreonine-4-phosphate dehydrogenase PdxA [Verrucomicrobiota bacterium]
MESTPTIAISIGDPAGIGPEVTLKALNDSSIRNEARLIVVGDRRALEAAEAESGVRLVGLGGVRLDEPGALHDPIEMGKISARCGRAALAYVRRATELCLSGEADAMVTAPLNKEAVTRTGQKFVGHTEFISELCGVPDARMLLINDRLRVLHVTTHRSLRQACDVTAPEILTTLRIGHEALAWLALKRKKIAVCGLNPHAGENGLFGTEDQHTVAPAIASARNEMIDCHGPLPADTVFLQALRGAFDLVIAMYHDQGHIPMKLLDFENTVNVSLGLPIIRTSVDHGTAFDIAGQNKANPQNMKAALKLAVTLARNRRERRG